MEQYSEIFVGIDVAKTRNTIAVADGERGGEVLGQVDASEENFRRLVRRLADRHRAVQYCLSKNRSTESEEYQFCVALDGDNLIAARAGGVNENAGFCLILAGDDGVDRNGVAY